MKGHRWVEYQKFPYQAYHARVVNKEGQFPFQDNTGFQLN